MTILIAGEIGRLNTITPSGSDEVCILSDGSLFRATVSNIGNILSITSQDSDYTVLTGDDVILVDATNGNVTIDLFTAVGNTGKSVIVKKIDSSGNSVITDGDGSETIDGAATFSTVTQYVAVTVISDGANWFII